MRIIFTDVSDNPQGGINYEHVTNRNERKILKTAGKKRI